MTPAPVAFKSVPIVEVPKFKFKVLLTLAEVPLDSDTAPVKLLAPPFVVKSIEVPAFRVVVPGTVIEPDWLMAAPAVRFKLPLSVKTGITILALALLKFKVKLRNAVSEVRLVGAAAAALTFVRLKSCTLPSVAPVAKLMAPLILLA